MDLDRLRLFIAVAERGSITAAAREVHLTQPAASRGVQLLEDELGAPLFERRPRGVMLTTAGRALLPRARQLLDEVFRTEREIARIARRDYHDLRVGAVDSVATYLLPGALAEVRARVPDLAIKVRSGRTQTLLEELASDRIDAAIIAWSGEPPGVDAERLGRYDATFFGCRERFPKLADVREEAGLREFPLVQIEALAGQPTLLDLEAPSYALTAGLPAVKSFVLSGFGVGALLPFMLSAEESARLVSAAVPHDPDCGLFLVTATGRARRGADSPHDLLASALRRALSPETHAASA